MRELTEHALDAANESLAGAFLDCPRVFWLDENDDADAVVRACGESARIDLAPEVADVRVSALVDGRRMDLTTTDASPHETLQALNRVLRHSHEIRMALASVGDDSLAFVVLPIGWWQQLDDDIGDALAQVVWQLDDDLDPFEDLDDDAVLSAYRELLHDEPGCYGDCLARALANPETVRVERDDVGEDPLLG